MYPPFTVDDLTPFPAGWVRARCRPEVAAPSVRAEHFDPDEHAVPGESCACGFRVYPGVALARDALALWPDRSDLRRSDLALAVVEYDGAIATRPQGRRMTDDEAGTLRVEWLRIVGPVVVSPGLPRQARRGVSRRYGLAADGVVKPDRAIVDALAEGELDDLVLESARRR